MKTQPHSFSEYPNYTDPGAINQTCRDFLKPFTGEARQLQIGVCELMGPGRVAEDTHDTWTQYFLVIEGEGILHLGNDIHPIAKDMIVEIPKGTPHYAECQEGYSLKYFFINIHDLK